MAREIKEASPRVGARYLPGRLASKIGYGRPPRMDFNGVHEFRDYFFIPQVCQMGDPRSLSRWTSSLRTTRLEPNQLASERLTTWPAKSASRSVSCHAVPV